MDKPIIFSSEMALTILSGKKTQTRRVIGKSCQYQKNNHLWVRETWNCDNTPFGEVIGYRAEIKPYRKLISKDKRNWFLDVYQKYGMNWRPSIFMPQWASRIKLQVIDIHHEPLRMINEDDAQAEGVQLFNGSYINGFIKMWDKMHQLTSNAWCYNPYVWVIKFKIIDPIEGIVP